MSSPALTPHLSSTTIIQSYPALGSYITKADGEWELGGLRDYVNKRFSTDGIPASYGDLPVDQNSRDRAMLDSIPSIPEKPKDNNVLSNIKLTLPSSQSTIKMLRPCADGEPSDDPDVLGNIIQKHYGTLWSDDCIDNDACINDYLDDYDKRIDPSLVKNLNLELVARAVANAPNSSRGPDGIPFSAYKALSDTATPLLLECALALQDNGLPLHSFNRARLTLLPKKATLLVDDTRPICVNNCDNRIIAKALVYSVSDAAQVLIGDYQKMFLPGRQMMDHLFSLNEEFYGSWREQHQRFVLFTDNKKAFDSIHHSYIFSVLRKLGFPLGSSTPFAAFSLTPQLFPVSPLIMILL
jgi:hypothetical protein